MKSCDSLKHEILKGHLKGTEEGREREGEIQERISGRNIGIKRE